MNIYRKLTITLGAVCLTIMVVLTCLDIGMRYFMNRPIFGSAEMIQMLLAITVFSGMYAVTRDRGHVNVSLFEPWLLRHFPRSYRVMFDLTSLLGVIGITAILLWKIRDLMSYPESTVVLGLPIIAIVTIMAVLSGLSVIAAWQAMRSDADRS